MLTVTYTILTNYSGASGNVTLQAATLILGTQPLGSLSGNMASVSSGVTVNLTSEGTLDWAHWGLNGAPGFDHKAGVTQQISNYSLIGTAGFNGGSLAAYSDLNYRHSWTGGTPTASATTATYVRATYSSYAGGYRGFKITVPADTTARTLKVYVGLSGGDAELQAQLSDNSAAPYTNAMPRVSVTKNYVYTLSYKAASAGQTLTVSYQLTTNGYVTLHAATLTGGAVAAVPQTDMVAPATASGTWNSPSSATPAGNASRRAATLGQFRQAGRAAAAPTSSIMNSKAVGGTDYFNRLMATPLWSGAFGYGYMDLAAAGSFGDDPPASAAGQRPPPSATIRAAQLDRT